MRWRRCYRLQAHIAGHVTDSLRSPKSGGSSLECACYVRLALATLMAAASTRLAAASMVASVHVELESDQFRIVQAGKVCTFAQTINSA